MRQSFTLPTDRHMTDWRLQAIEDQVDFAQTVISEALDALHSAQLQARYGKMDHLVKLIDKTFKALECASDLSAIEDEIETVRNE